VTATTVPATTTTTAPITTTTAPTTTTTQETTTTTAYVGEGTQYIFDDIDKILYDDTLTTAKKTSEINKYLYKKALSHEIPMNVILDIKKDVSSVLNSQSESTKVSNDIKNSLDSYLNSVSASNGSSIESICTNLIKSAFKQGVYDAQETVKLLKSLHSNIESRVEQAKAEEIANGIYDHYEFVSSANALNGLSGYSDLQGWIYIPNANIDYPIMHSTEDNDYYLQHDMNGYSSSQGCIELDYRCNLFANAVIDSSYTNNSIIYGHNLNNGVMFSNLARYKDPNYWNANKLIEVTTYSGQRLYEIYACCSVYGMGDGTQFNYWNAKYLNMDYELFQEYMYLTQETMLYQTGNFPTFGQDILTLQTCDGNDGWRIVVFAKRVK
jgi:sortase B